MSISVLKAFIDFNLRDAFAKVNNTGRLYSNNFASLSNGHYIETNMYDYGVTTRLYDPENHVHTRLSLIQTHAVTRLEALQKVDTISHFNKFDDFKYGESEARYIHILRFILTDNQQDISSIELHRNSGDKWNYAEWNSDKPEKFRNFTLESSQALKSAISDFYCANMIGIQHGQMPDFSKLQSVIKFPLIAVDALPKLVEKPRSARALSL